MDKYTVLLERYMSYGYDFDTAALCAASDCLEDNE